MKKKTEEEPRKWKAPEYIFMDDVQWPQDSEEMGYLEKSEAD